MAYPEDITSTESSEEESSRKVVDRLFELLARKRTHLYDALMGCLRRTGQYEAVQLLQRQQGESAANHMDTEDASEFRKIEASFVKQLSGVPLCPWQGIYILNLKSDSSFHLPLNMN